MKTRGNQVIFLFLFLLKVDGFSQGIRTPISSAYLGVGAYSNNHIDPFSIQSNQAALAKMKNAAAGIYGEKRFFLTDLSFYDVTLDVPTHSGNFGLDARYFGFARYNEMQLGFAYARSVGSGVDVGVQFNYYTIHVAGYGNASTVNFDIATILHVTDKLNTGLHVYNPVSKRLGKNGEEKLASIFTVGAGYEPSEKFFLSIEVVKEEDKPVNVNAGLQYEFLDQVSARAGIASATSAMFFGVGFKWKSMRLDATATYQQPLGITPGLVLLLQRAQKKESTQEDK